MVGSPTRIGRGAAVAYTFVVVGLALSGVLIASMPGRADGTPVPELAAYDTMIPPTDEGRAQFGQLFIGEVVAVAGEDKIPTSDPEDVLPVIIYDVEVEQTLKGQAAGRVQVWYEGFDYTGPDQKPAGELQVGERYIFFAGFDPDNDWFLVNASLGVLPIKNDKAEAELVATFEPLIRRAERRAEPVPAPDPCEEVGQPTITVEPQQGRVGDAVTVSAENLVRPEVSIWWDGTDHRLTTATVTDDCSMTVEVAIPKADTGEHQIVVQDARGESAAASFEVTKE
jgi:hypothetical protein